MPVVNVPATLVGQRYGCDQAGCDGEQVYSRFEASEPATEMTEGAMRTPQGWVKQTDKPYIHKCSKCGTEVRLELKYPSFGAHVDPLPADWCH